MERYQSIDNKIQKGYELIMEHNLPGGCDQWLEAWDDIREIFAEGIAKDIFELNQQYDWTQYISNYVQDLEQELRNAGLKDEKYHLKRALFCQEMLQWCERDDLIISNIRWGMAEGYFRSGDTATGERLFTEWLEKDPDWGWGYIGWSDCYWFATDNKQYGKAEAILLDGYAKSGLRDRIYLVGRLVTLYGEMGNPEKSKEFKKIYSELQRNEPQSSPYYKPVPAKSEKIGRNDPCPCGSGKKYKKCCGA